MQHYRILNHLRVGVCSSFILWSVVTAGIAQAQISADTTLPRNSNVRSRGNSSVITGGTRAGSNLFHSFREFSVPTNGTASFQQIDSDVANIITRVTGTSISNIDGAIEALQSNGTVSSANFFLLNPNGIVFGPNASLNLGGSFLATTAHSLDFADGFQFRSDGTQSSPLLTVSVPTGLQLGRTAGAIVNQSRSNLVKDRTLNQDSDIIGGGLQVARGRTLALISNGLSLPGGVLTTEEGRIELGSVAGRGNRLAQVNLQPRANGWNLDYTGVSRFQDIQLSQGASLNTSGAGGGRIELQGRGITLTEQSIVASTTQGDRNGRAIRVRAEQLNLDHSSEMRAFTRGAGNSGDIRIRTNQLRIRGGGRISAATFGVGDGGNVAIVASDSIVISGEGAIQVTETGSLRLRTDPSISARTTLRASGRGGSISIATETLRLEQGVQISTSTFGTGDAGTIDIRADVIELTGVLLYPEGTVYFNENRPQSSGLFAGTTDSSRGNGGNLTITANRLSLSNGATIRANTQGRGNAGNLTIRASESIEVTGTAGDERLPTSILAASGMVPGIEFYTEENPIESATGRGGNLNVRTRDLQVRDGAVIAVGSLNPRGAAGAGRLDIQAENIYLQEQGRVLAETASGDGGSINLQVENLLLLQQNSDISTSAGRVQAEGSGGDIAINADAIVAAPVEDSDISADAYRDRGGNIYIDAQGILGIAQQPRNSPFSSDITASSALGISGSIQINSPRIDPSQGLIGLPETVVDASRLITQRCSGYSRSMTRRQSEFIITGAGGLPPTPGQPANSALFWEDLRPPLPSNPATSVALSRPPSQNIIEAQGWIVNPDGEIILTADASVVTPSAASSEAFFPLFDCSQSS